MAKRGLSKSQIALKEARERIEKAASNVEDANNRLMAMQAVYTAHTEAYYALERTLTRSKSDAPAAEKKSSRKGVEPLLTQSTEGDKENALDVSSN